MLMHCLMDFDFMIVALTAFRDVKLKFYAIQYDFIATYTAVNINITIHPALTQFTFRATHVINSGLYYSIRTLINRIT